MLRAERRLKGPSDTEKLEASGLFVIPHEQVFTGESRGVREGGVMEHHLWELRVEALPEDIPESLTGDITHLLIGDHLRVADVVAPSGVEIVTDPEEIILSVVESQATRAAELIEAELLGTPEVAEAPEEEAEEPDSE